MKRIILGIISSTMILASVAKAEVGLNIGVSGHAGIGAASAKEVNAQTHENTEIGALGYGSIFLEKSFGRVAIGIDYAPTLFESETTETAKSDMSGDSTQAVVENKVQVDLEEMMTLYASVYLTDEAYVRAGITSVDVITNENLATGASYGNTSLDGTVFGVGYNKTLDNGMFVRVEGNYLNFDGASLTSGDNTITLKNVDAVTGTLSVGKTF